MNLFYCQKARIRKLSGHPKLAERLLLPRAATGPARRRYTRPRMDAGEPVEPASEAEPSGPLVIAQGAFPRLRELQGLLRAAGIEAQVVGPPGDNASA